MADAELAQDTLAARAAILANAIVAASLPTSTAGVWAQGIDWYYVTQAAIEAIPDDDDLAVDRAVDINTEALEALMGYDVPDLAAFIQKFQVATAANSTGRDWVFERYTDTMLADLRRLVAA